MGSIILNDQLDEPSSSQLELIMDWKKPVNTQLTQLMHWSLSEIRNIYAPFRKRKSSPLLTRSQFLRLLRLSRISAFHIYNEISKIDVINAFELMAVLILTAYTTKTYKIQFLFAVFDLLSVKILKFSDLILMFKSVVKGYAFLTGQQSPDIQTLQKYAQTIFSKADLNNDQNLSLMEVLGWAQANKEVLDLLNRFQPKIYGKQQYHIFNSFFPYKQEEIQMIHFRIKKSHFGQEIKNEDYQLLKIQSKLPKAFMKENTFMMNSCLNEKNEQKSKFGRSSIKKNTLKQNQSFLLNPTSSLIKLPQFNKFGLSGSFLPSDQLSNRPTQTFKKNKFNNIIIIKGRTITKRQVFDLQDYFDKLSDGKDHILIQDFIDSFSQQKYNHMKSVAASLYNFLDHDQNGKVTFKKLLLKIYPNLTSEHIQTIDSWCLQYNENFNIKSKIKVNQQSEQTTKKRVLPKACMVRFKEMFQFYDKERKGYIDLDDMRKVLNEVCSEKQINQLFEDSDRDKDGKISLFQFSNLILPMDLEIQGLQ